MISDDDKKIIITYAKIYKISSVILFGSSANKQKSNDIDIGVKGIKSEQFFDFYWDIYSRLSKPVDVINLNKKSKFSNLIEQYGKVIYSGIER